MAKSLFISYDGLTDPLGQSQVIPYLVGLAKKNNEIHILSCEKKEAFSKRYYLISEILTISNIKWHPMIYHKSPPVLSTIYDLIRLNKTAKVLHKKHQFEIVHCRSYIAAHVGLWMKLSYNTNFIFDMRGFWADERVEGGIWKMNNPIFKVIYKYFKRKERDFILNADSIISLTKSAKHEIINNTKFSGGNPLKENRISIIPTCVDTTHFDPLKVSDNKKSEIKTELGIKNNEFVLLYIGSIGTWYMLDEMLLFFITFKEQKPNARFLFLTAESSFVILKTYQKLCNLEGLKFNSHDIIIKQIDRINIPAYISICHISVFFIRPTYSKKGSSATKMAELLAMGKPFITNSGWGDISLIVDNSIGVTIDNFSKKDYKNASSLILKSTYNENLIRASSEGYLNLNYGIEKYHSIYKDLLFND